MSVTYAELLSIDMTWLTKQVSNHFSHSHVFLMVQVCCLAYAESDPEKKCPFYEISFFQSIGYLIGKAYQ